MPDPLRRWLASNGTELVLIPVAVLGAILLVHLVVRQ